MSDLRERLARRLWETQTDRKFHSGDDWETIVWREKPTAEQFLRFADECILQMEWARDCGEQELFTATTIPYTRKPLVPCPDDWKVPE